MILPDWRIKEKCVQRDMIVPYVKKTQEKGLISYGQSSYGYDIRIQDNVEKPETIKIFTAANCAEVDPKNFEKTACTVNANLITDENGTFFRLPPNSYALCLSVERFFIPRNVIAICLGKSTYARCGVIVNVTPLESEWQGHLVIEISNGTPLPIRIYANEGIAQLLFFEGEEPLNSYADKKGKYQHQSNDELTYAKIKK